MTTFTTISLLLTKNVSYCLLETVNELNERYNCQEWVLTLGGVGGGTNPVLPSGITVKTSISDKIVLVV